MSQNKSALEKKRLNFIPTPKVSVIPRRSIEDVEKLLKATYL
jgi:hypothetical protein